MKLCTEYITRRIMENNRCPFDSREGLWTRWCSMDRRRLYLDVIKRKDHVIHVQDEVEEPLRCGRTGS